MDDKPIVSDGTRFGSREWYDARWKAVPPETRASIVRHLKEQLPTSLVDEVKQLKAENDEDWIAPYHFAVGMSVRNVLREVLGDDELPPAPYPDGSYRNWDDYYVQALEAAAGVRDV